MPPLMPSRKKLKDKGKGKQKKEMRQFANSSDAEIIRGIHDGKPGATWALAMRAHQHKGDFHPDHHPHECASIIEATLNILKRCDENLASVFGVAHSDSVLMSMSIFCLRKMSVNARHELSCRRRTPTICHKIIVGISPVIKCMVAESRVLSQSTEVWFKCEYICEVLLSLDSLTACTRPRYG